MPAVLLLGFSALLWFASGWLQEPMLRGVGQALAVLAFAGGVMLVATGAESPFSVPGFGPRRWHSP